MEMFLTKCDNFSNPTMVFVFVLTVMVLPMVESLRNMIPFSLIWSLTSVAKIAIEGTAECREWLFTVAWFNSKLGSPL